MFHEEWELERFQSAKVTFKVIQEHWQWCHCNYVSVLHCFQDIITYFPKI